MKKLAVILIFVLILSVSMCAFAAPYTDQTYQYGIEIPEGDTVYYYTAEGSNMTEDMLSAVQGKTPAPGFVVAQYENGKSLSYSLDILVTPLSEALSDPASSALTDISQLTEDQTALLVQNKESEYGADYIFASDPSEVLSSGKTALSLTGQLAQDNGYTTKIYLTVDNGNLLTITMLYKNDPADVYLSAAQGVLSTLTFAGASPAITPTVVPTTTPTEAPVPTSAVVLTPQPTQQTEVWVPEFLQNIGANISNSYYNDPYFPLYVVGICIVAALIIIMIVLIKASRKKNKEFKDSDRTESVRLSCNEHAEVPPISSNPLCADTSDGDLSSYTSQSSSTSSTGEMGTPTRPTIAEEYLSRRAASLESTQASSSAPARVQYPSSSDTAAQRIADDPYPADSPRRSAPDAIPPTDSYRTNAPQQAPDDTSRPAIEPSRGSGISTRPKVGSRVERNRKKKK